MNNKQENHQTECRLEYMRPEQIDAAQQAYPAIYVPFGSIEWHGQHLPVGLDTIKAHQLLVELAEKRGGVVHPAIYYSSGGGHNDFAYTFMYDKELIQKLVVNMLWHFERSGYKVAILLTGHAPNRLEYLIPATITYMDQGGKMDVFSLFEGQATRKELGCGHACRIETSMMLKQFPDTVRMESLYGEYDEDILEETEIHNWMTSEYQEHPCYGIVGTDPRTGSSAALGQKVTDEVLQTFEDWLDGKIEMHIKHDTWTLFPCQKPFVSRVL